MGKRQRERKRQQASHTGTPLKPDVHITVAALSTTGELDLSHEVSLVKASWLYADRVTLASPKVMLLAGTAALFSEDNALRLHAVAEAVGALDKGRDFRALYEALRSKPRLNQDELLLKAQLETVLRKTGDELGQVMDKTLEEAGAAELVPAFEAGLVEVDSLGVSQEDEGDFSDVVVDHMQCRLTELVSKTETSYPLFDDEAGGILRAMVSEGHLADPQFQLANEVGVARSLITGLDAFPNASMDVVLDVRDRLQRPLVRFRAAVAEATRELDATAIDRDFERHVQDIYRRLVAPAILELEEALEELRARPTLQRGWPSSASGAVAFLAAAAVGAPELLHMAALGGGLSVAAVRELTHRDRVASEQRKNRFLFLYEADRELTRRST